MIETIEVLSRGPRSSAEARAQAARRWVGARVDTLFWIKYLSSMGFYYGKLLNATQIRWVWNTTVPVAGSPYPAFHDELWIVKNQAVGSATF